MNNYLKYLKYKQKYLDLKNLNLNGGNSEYKLGFDHGLIGYNRYPNDNNYSTDYHRGRLDAIKSNDYYLGINDCKNGKKNIRKNKEYIKGYEEADIGLHEF
jgi:hypothetical protein